MRAWIEASMQLGAVICIPDPAEAAARDAAMVPAAQGGQVTEPPPVLTIGPGILRDGDPHAGQLFVQGRVEYGGKVGRLDDVVGRGWTLLSTVCDPVASLDPETRTFFRSIGGIGAHVATEGPVRDTDGTYANWFETAGVEVVLQRPDYYLYGAAAPAEAAGELIARLRLQLSGH